MRSTNKFCATECILDAQAEVVACLHNFYSQPYYANLSALYVRRGVFFHLIFALTKFICRFRLGVFLLITLIFLFYPKMRQPKSSNCIFQFGLSHNNERMFSQLNTLMANSDSWHEDMNGKKINFIQRLQWLDVPTKWHFAKKIQDFNTTETFTLIQMMLGSAAVVMFREAYQENPPCLVVVSNDHSGIYVAVRCVAHELNINVVYIQHAPVNEYFPPLKFDLSILYDQASIDSYRKSASKSNVKFHEGKILLLSPFKEKFVLPRVKANKQLRIGILLSLVPNYEALNVLLDKLYAHHNVKSIGIKTHPRYKEPISKCLALSTKYDFFIAESNKSLRDFLGGYGDVVLADSSGAVIESMHLGCPTYRVSGIDHSTKVGYSFAHDNIFPDFDIEILDDAHKINAPFTMSWAKAFSRSDATYDFSIEHMEISIRKSLEGLLAKT